MDNPVVQWALGLVIVLCLVSYFRMKIEGIFAWILLTAVSWGLGVATIEVVRSLISMKCN